MTTNTFVLIDAALLHIDGYQLPFDETNSPNWLRGLYRDVELRFSPILMDVASSEEAKEIQILLELMNAMHPQVHVSLIDSSFDLDVLAKHLKRFIFFVDERGKRLTVRFADAVSMTILAPVLTVSQLRTMMGPMKRWGAHDRTGKLVMLPSCSDEATATEVPLALTYEQQAEINEAQKPHSLIAKVISAWPSYPFEESQLEDLARRVLLIWEINTCSGEDRLVALATIAFQTNGAILDSDELQNLLNKKEDSAFYDHLRELASRFHKYLPRGKHAFS